MSIEVSTTQATLLIIAAVWELAWKGVSLWKASRNNQQNWFIALLILNTLGILPIVYILTHSITKEHLKDG